MINDERMEFNLMFKDNKNMCGRWVFDVYINNFRQIWFSNWSLMVWEGLTKDTLIDNFN